jgi:hypothetical protein
VRITLKQTGHFDLEKKNAPVLSIGYRCEDRKKVGYSGSVIDAIRSVFTLSFRKSRLSPPKIRTVQSGDAFEDTAFKPWFEIVKY